jgi:tetratricopeptide (TPR) repeat protein
MTKLRAPLLFASAAVLAACQQMPANEPASPPTAPQPRAEVVPAPAPAPTPMPTGPVSASQQQQAQRIAMSAVGMLELGHEDDARAELQRALGTDPNNKLAQNLMRQITSDPVAMLGQQSFNYTVRPNESLSMIAGRFLGDIYLFYALARYNNIEVPRQVAGGHTLRIPGKAPPPATARETRPSPPPAPAPERETARVEPAPAPVVAAPAAPPEPTPAERAMRAAEAAERGGNLEVALVEYRKAASLNEGGADAKAAHVQSQLVQRYSLNARTAFARQDLDGAIRSWDAVLQVDPKNETARLERQRALALRDKAKKL